MNIPKLMADHSTVPTNRNVLNLQRPLVLVGLMGAGKSTIGKRLARSIELDFIDSDTEIAQAAGCSIADIFEIYGEAMFRDLEKNVLLRLLGDTAAVIATGGGAFIHPETRKAILARSISVWLKADIDVLVERVSRRDTRPLLKSGDKRDILSRLINDRHPVYAQANITVDSGDTSHEVVVNKIIAALTLYGKDATA